MAYPVTPFTNKLNLTTIFNLKTTTNTSVPKDFNNFLSWLCLTPKTTTVRVNTLKNSVKTVKQCIKSALIDICSVNHKTVPAVSVHPILPDVILIEPFRDDELNLDKRVKEIIVDVACGTAVLRGANVFAPGVMAMQTGTKIGDKVSVYADISRKCKKGLSKVYECSEKVFVGNGTVKMVRNEIYGENLSPNGVAIEITDALSGCSNFNETCLTPGAILLQNIPSIVVGHVLNPKPGDCVLDMCASPGNKTTHLAALMKNQGTLIAIDKTPKKVDILTKKCSNFGLTCIKNFDYDSTVLCSDSLKFSLDNSVLSQGPPFAAGMFDKILLDAPCSGLGNRPQLLNQISDKVCRSYVPLQRKLFQNAVQLLKPGGTLVFSTCTITLGENEGMVAWALETFEQLQLVISEPVVGGPGWPGTNLTPEQLQVVQRFGPEQTVDSIAFFISKFRKFK